MCNYLITQSHFTKTFRLKRSTEEPLTLLQLANMERCPTLVWWPRCRLRLKHKPKHTKRRKLAVEQQVSWLRLTLTPTMNAAITRSSTMTLSTMTLPWLGAHISFRRKLCSRTTPGWRMQRNWRNVPIKHKFKCSKRPSTLHLWAWQSWWAINHSILDPSPTIMVIWPK